MKRKLPILITFCITTLIAVLSCSKTSEDKLMNTIACDTTSVKYSVDIKSILQNSCYSCHGNTSSGSGAGIVLEGYSNLTKWVANGILIGNVTHANGFVAMPYGLPKLPDCEVNKIIAWVHQGALNN